MGTTEDRARRIFGARAAFYSTSSAHADADVLARVVELAQAQATWRVLDVGTGPGHTAFALAPHVAEVVAADITPEMLAEGERLRGERGIGNVRFETADVHELPYEDGAFHLVTCRRAAHHFADVEHAIGEIRRVLGRGGRLLIDDRSVPDDDFVDATMNLLDSCHDRSHVRQYRPSEWEQMLTAAGFEMETVETYTRHRPVADLTRGATDVDAAHIHEIVAGLDDAQRRAMNVYDVDGMTHLNHWYVTLAATRRSGA